MRKFLRAYLPRTRREILRLVLVESFAVVLKVFEGEGQIKAWLSVVVFINLKPQGRRDPSPVTCQPVMFIVVMSL